MPFIIMKGVDIYVKKSNGNFITDGFGYIYYKL